MSFGFTKKMRRYFSEVLPGFYYLDTYVFCNSSENILYGIQIDKTPHTYYVWSFNLPLYDEIEFIYLSFGERKLFRSRNSTEISIEEEGLRELISSQLELAKSRSSTQKFLENFEYLEHSKNPRHLKILSIAYFLSGQFVEAVRLAEKVISLSTDTVSGNYYRENRYIKNLLKGDFRLANEEIDLLICSSKYKLKLM